MSRIGNGLGDYPVDTVVGVKHPCSYSLFPVDRASGGPTMTPYSLVEHIAKAIWISRWREGWFGVFTAYFDGSGHE